MFMKSNISILFLLLFYSCVKSKPYYIFQKKETQRFHCAQHDVETDKESVLVEKHSHMSYPSKDECEKSGNFYAARFGDNKSPPATGMDACIAKGRSYYSDIGSYPNLSTGEKAEDVIKSKCANTETAFQ